MPTLRENPYESPQSVMDFAATDFVDVGEIHTAGTLSVRDVLEASSLACSRYPRVYRWGIWSALCLMLLLFFVLDGTIHVHGFWITGLNAAPETGTLLLIFPGLFLFAFGLSLANRGRLHGMRRRGERPFSHVESWFTSDMIRQRSASVESSMQWSAFCGYRKSKRVVVLFLRYPGDYISATRELHQSEEDWQRFLALVQRKLPAR